MPERTFAAPVPTTQTLPTKVALGALVLFLLFAPYQFSGFWPATYDFWPQAFMLLLGAGMAVSLALSGQKSRPLELPSWLLLAFLTWGAITVVTAAYKHDAVLEFSRVLGALTWFFVLRHLWTPERSLLILGALVLGVTWICVPAVLDFLRTRNPRQFGPFYNPNLFANAIAMALPLAVIFPLVVWRYTRRLPAVLAAAMPTLILFPGLAVTSSKGGLLAAGAGLIICAYALLHAKRGAAGSMLRHYWPFLVGIFLICAIGGGMLASKTVLPRLQGTFGRDDHSTMFRVYTWKGTLAMAQAKPVLGHGPGSFPSAYPQFAQAGYTRSAHQSWLQLAAENGFPGLVLMLAACGTAALAGWRGLQGREWPVAAGSLGSLGAFFFHGLTDAGWGVSSILFLLAVTLGILVSSSDPERETLAKPGLSLPWIALALLLGGAGYATQQAATGEASRDVSDRLVMERNAPLALQEAMAAVAADPYSARLRIHLGNMQVMNGQNPEAAFRSAIALQPTRAGNHLQLARALAAAKSPEAGPTFDRAITLDPLDTGARLERAEWLFAHNDNRGFADLKAIVGLKQAPYGLYPATPEWVNLDFARATVQLVPRLRQEKVQEQVVQELIKSGLKDVANARAFLDTQRQMLEAVQGEGNIAPLPEDLDVVEARLNRLRKPAAPAAAP